MLVVQVRYEMHADASLELIEVQTHRLATKTQDITHSLIGQYS